MISGILSWSFNESLGALFEIDEIAHETLPDGRIKVIFVTSGIDPNLAKIKTTIWSIFAVPLQRPEEITVEELQKGAVIKRYRITVILRPLLKR